MRTFVTVLVEEEAGGLQRVVATGVATFLFAVAVAAATHARTPLGEWPAFVPIFASLACAADGLTAFLLFVQARVARSFPLLVLAGAYAFSACAVVPHLAFSPGIFGAGAAFGASSQSSTWFWVFWHGAFALAALGYVAARSRSAGPPYAARIGAAHIAGGLALIVTLAGGLAGLARVCAAVWPAAAGSGSDDLLVETGIGPAILLTIALALGALIVATKLRTVTHLWLAVALAAALLDCALTLVAGERFTTAWYAARLESLFASTVLLAAFLRMVGVMFERLARLSSVDGLTGLANRRTFDERLVLGASITLRAGGSMSLLMLDLDQFKHYNERYGHAAGDDALRAIARTLSATLARKTDVCARYGGEEFAVVLPSTGAAGAQSVAERVCEAVRELAIPHAGSAHNVLTVSVGVSTLTAHEGRGTRSAATLVTSADRALVRAKEAGRNRVAIADLPLPLTLPDGRSVSAGSS
jgi:diguanylate cyclase (GGDEF)-like protein